MERATTFFGDLGEFTANAARWIVLFGRKYPLAAATYLVICVFGFFNYLNQSALPPSPSPLTTQNLSPTNTSSAPAPLAPISAPAVSVAQSQAFKNGNSVIIRWDQPVIKPSLYADGNSLTASCQPQSCTANLPQQVSSVDASWQQSGQFFKKKFQL